MRVLILMSDTGGGHRAAAEAIREGLTHLYGRAVSVTIVDAFRHHTAWPLQRLPEIHAGLVHKAGPLYEVALRLERQTYLSKPFLQMFYPACRTGLGRLFVEQKPDVIVSVHALLSRWGLQALQRTGLSISFVTVVTDLIDTVKAWYQPGADLCLVPLEATREEAIRAGLNPRRIKVTGLPISLRFAQPVVDRRSLRAGLNLQPDRPAILLAGGSEGYGGPIFDIARALACRRLPLQLMIVAGRNQALRRKLEAVQWEIPTRIFGYVTNMPELMQGADLFITKAGPGSLSEAFAAHLPVIIFGYLPGLEDGNIAYVTDHRAGVYQPDPAEIADLLADWLAPDNPTLSRMAQNAANLAAPQAALTIARHIYENRGVF